MGRTKFSQHEIDIIGMLLRRKNAGTRFQQKMIRHQLRVNFEFNISDFNVQGKAFGEEDLHAAINRGAIQILDDATIATMKAKRAADRAKDAMKMAADNTSENDDAMATAMATWTDEQWEKFAMEQNEKK